MYIVSRLEQSCLHRQRQGWASVLALEERKRDVSLLTTENTVYDS